MNLYFFCVIMLVKNEVEVSKNILSLVNTNVPYAKR